MRLSRFQTWKVLLLALTLPCVFEGSAFAKEDEQPPKEDVSTIIKDAISKQTESLKELIEDKITPISTKVQEFDIRIGGLEQDVKSLEKQLKMTASLSSAGVTPRRTIASARVVRAISAATPTFPVPDQQSAPTVHFLVFSLVDDPINKIGPGTVANYNFITSLGVTLQSFLGSDSARLHIVTPQTPSPFTKDLFNSTLDGMGKNSDQDTIFCYISTHGGFDQTGGHHVYTSDSQWFARRDIFAKLSARNARQTILITDSCATPISVPAGGKAMAAAVVNPFRIYNLLFNFSGDLNMNACSVNEESFYRIGDDTDTGGGLFTRAFMRTSVEENPADWAAFFTTVTQLTADEGKNISGAKPQNPALFDENGMQVFP